MKRLLLLAGLLLALVTGVALAQDDVTEYNNGVISFSYPADWVFLEDDYAGGAGAANSQAALDRLEDQADGSRGLPDAGDLAIVVIAFPEEFVSLLDASLSFDDPSGLALGLKTNFLSQDYAPGEFTVTDPVLVTLGGHDYYEMFSSAPGRDELTLFRVDGDVVLGVFGVTSNGEIENVRAITYGVAETAEAWVLGDVLWGILTGEVNAEAFEPTPVPSNASPGVGPGSAAAAEPAPVPDGLERFDNGIIQLDYPMGWVLLSDDYAVTVSNSQAGMDRYNADTETAYGSPDPGDLNVTVAAFPADLVSLLGMQSDPMDAMAVLPEFVLAAESGTYALEEIQVGVPEMISIGGRPAALLSSTLPNRDELFILHIEEDGSLLFAQAATAPGEIDNVREVLFQIAATVMIQQDSQTLMGILTGEIDPSQFAPRDDPETSVVPDGQQGFDNGILRVNFPAEWVVLSDQFAGVVEAANNQPAMDRVQEAFIGSPEMPLAGDQAIEVQAYPPEFLDLMEVDIPLDDPVAMITDLAVVYQEVNYTSDQYKLSAAASVEIGGETYGEVTAVNPNRAVRYLGRVTPDGAILVIFGAAPPGELDALIPTMNQAVASVQVLRSGETLRGILFGEIDAAQFAP